MEKRRPHYDLKAIQEQMTCIEAMNLTMTVHNDNRVWQDVYHAEWRGKALYLKFQQHDEYFIVSFKER
jgi:motility quorum-sensing regulator / GCU-specific mRNA interferase toxin